MGGERAFTVRFHHPAAAVFGYLSDPARRPEWQSSLRRIDPITEQVAGVGARWYDVTAAGIRPEMAVVEHVAPRRWAEEGRWRGVTAYLALELVPVGEETDVEVLVRIHAVGAFGPVAALAGALAPLALRRDLARADRRIAGG